MGNQKKNIKFANQKPVDYRWWWTPMVVPLVNLNWPHPNNQHPISVSPWILNILKRIEERIGLNINIIFIHGWTWTKFTLWIFCTIQYGISYYVPIPKPWIFSNLILSMDLKNDLLVNQLCITLAQGYRASFWLEGFCFRVSLKWINFFHCLNTIYRFLVA